MRHFRVTAPALVVVLSACAPSATFFPDLLHTLNLGPGPTPTPSQVTLGVPYTTGVYHACLSDKQLFANLAAQASITHAALDAQVTPPQLEDAAFTIQLAGEPGQFALGDTLSVSVTPDGARNLKFAVGEAQDLGGKVLLQPRFPDPTDGTASLQVRAEANVPLWVTGPAGACFTARVTRSL